MKFVKKEGKIKMELIKKADFNTLFLPNNNILLQKIIENLISSKIHKSDYDDENKYLLFKSLQNILEYLFAKKNKINNVNKNIKSNIDNTMKKAVEMEKQLIENKKIIEENYKIKKEEKDNYLTIKKKYEKTKQKQENIKNSNDNKDMKVNIKIFNVEKNVKETINKHNENNINNIYITKKYLCPLCKDKFFSNKENQNSHIIRRHPKLYQKLLKKRKNIKNIKYNFDSYIKEIYELEKYIKEIIEINDDQKEKYEEVNEKNGLSEVIESQKKIFEEEIMKPLENIIKNQNELYNNLLTKLNNDSKNEILEREELIQNEIKKLFALKEVIREFQKELKEFTERLKKENKFKKINNKNEIIDLGEKISFLKSQYLSIIPEIYSSKVKNEENDEENEKNFNFINEDNLNKEEEIEEKEEKKEEEKKEEKKKEEEKKEEEEKEEAKEEEKKEEVEIQKKKNKLSVNESVDTIDKKYGVKNENKSKLIINRIKITNDGEEIEKKNKKFLGNFFKEYNINININWNSNKNEFNKLNKEKNRLSREINIKTDKVFNTNIFV